MTDQFGAALKVIARILLVLSASLIIFASMLFLLAVFICFSFRTFFRQRFIVGQFDHIGHSLTELARYEFIRNFLIFNRIVQKRGDDQVGIFAMRCLCYEARPLASD